MFLNSITQSYDDGQSSMWIKNLGIRKVECTDPHLLTTIGRVCDITCVHQKFHMVQQAVLSLTASAEITKIRNQFFFISYTTPNLQSQMRKHFLI